MHPSIAASLPVVLLVIVALASVVLLVLIIVAPWKRVREEPPLNKDVEARLLLHRPHPEEPTGEIPTTRITDLADHDGTDDADAGDFAELREMDDG